MDYRHPVDYETYYFTEILERINRKASQELPAEYLADLITFLNFMKAADTPREGVEKLARISGTSDFAIFFADILDKLPEENPEESVQRIEEYASDFLTMFVELSQDARWKAEVFSKMTGVPVEEEERVSFREFVVQEIRQSLEKFLENKDEEVQEVGQQLIRRISFGEDFKIFLQKFKDVPGFKPLCESLETLLRLPQKKEDIEEYLTRFPYRLAEFLRHMDQVARGNPETFQAFCVGEIPEIAGEEEELERLAKSAKELDLRKTATVELTEEDKQLRLLLREYIIHEIEELGKELTRAIGRYNEAPGSQEAVESILSSVKILKDLGQIHKYPGIEQVASDLQKVLGEYVRNQVPFTPKATTQLGQLDQLFIRYIDDVLSEKDQEALEELETRYRELVAHLKPEKKPVFALDSEAAHSAFKEVNTRFIHVLQSLFEELFQNPKDEERFARIDSTITHIKNWYQLLKLDVALKMLQTIQENLLTLQGREVLLSHRSVLDKILQELQTRLFSLATEDLQLLRQLEEEVPQPVGVEEAGEAFQDVTLRQLEQLIEASRNDEIEFSDFLENYFEPILEQIAENSALIGNDDLQLICNYLLSRTDLLRSIPLEHLAEIRQELPRHLRELQEKVRELPKHLSVNEMTRLYDEVLEGWLTKAEEEPAEAEEEEIPEKPVEEVAEAEAAEVKEETVAETAEEQVEAVEKDREEIGEEEKEEVTEETPVEEVAPPPAEEEVAEVETPTAEEQVEELEEEAVETALREELVVEEEAGEAVGEEELEKREEVPAVEEEAPEEEAGEALVEEAAKETEEVPAAEEEAEVEEAAEEESSPTREAFIDEELTRVFYTETRRYLATISEKLNMLEKQPTDRKVLTELGNVIHTLKGSAQMLNQEVVAQITRPLEDVVDRILDDELHLTEQFVPLYREAVEAIQRWMEGEELQVSEILKKVEEYEEASRVGIQPEEVPEEIATEEEAPEIVEEAVEEEIPAAEEAAVEEGEEYLELSEKDPELLEIFRKEVSSNLDIFDKHLALIEKFQYDKKTVQTLDQSIHEVRAAAKMLGFSEVGKLLDVLEEVIEELEKKEQKHWDDAIPELRKGVAVVRELSEAMKVSREKYEEALEGLNQLRESLQKPEKVVEEETLAAEEETAVEEEVLTEEEEVEAPKPPPAVVEAFIQESRELLEDINFLLMKIEKEPENEEFSYHLMRSLHTLKGSAAMVELEKIETITHLAEDLVEAFRNRGETIPQDAIDVLFEVVDEVEFQVDALASGLKEKTRNYQEIVEKLQSFFRAKEKPEEVPVAEKEEKPAEPVAEEEAVLEVEVKKEEPEKPPVRDTYIRLHADQMDKLLNEAAELVINHTQLKTQLDRFKSYLPRMDMESKNVQNVLWYLDKVKKDEERLLEILQTQKLEIPGLEETSSQQLENLNRAINSLRIFYNNFIQNLQGIKELTTAYEEQIHKISRLSSSIHDEVMEARLVPIAMLFQRFHRPLRDMARKSGKRLKLVLEGESTELDRVLIEDLYEPLLHILRNAVDHGIESTEERKKAGKPEEGTIALRASHDRNFVTIEIEDDGRGVDLKKVREKAIQLGYLEADKADELSDQELLEFLMYPGFTTREEATTISGRGVGLDVVRSQIQKIKGDLRIFSEEGKGTRFIIRVPISLTVTQAMLVEVAGHVYAIPLLQAEETINIEVRSLELRDNSYYMRHRGGYIPVLNLANLLQIRAGKRKPISVVGEYPAIVVQDEGHRVALLVDRIVHREEILIKSLGPNLQRVKFITGGSVLADGKVVLVLDIPQIIKEAVRMQATGAVLSPEDLTKPEEVPAKAGVKRKKRLRVVKGRKPSVLVVDDSLSIRKFLASLLTQRGYQVEMAKNGYNALEKLNQQDFDVLITDLEMPHLSGYELIEQVRDEDRWKEMPIIVLTGRASKHIQQLTRTLGADEFIVKPFKEDELMKLLGEYIVLED